MRRWLIFLVALCLIAAVPAASLLAQSAQPASAGDATASAAEPDGAAAVYSPWAPPVLLIGFVLLICLPFLPGLSEVYWPRDRYPLPIDTQYTKDPRYLGKSARKVFAAAVEKAPEGDGPHLLWMSHEEQVVVSGKRDIAAKTAMDQVLYVGGDLTTGEECIFAKDIYATGAADLGDGNSVRTLAADGDLNLGEGARVMRWVDSEQDLTVAEDCDLGHSASCAGHLALSNAVTFRRLYGRLVTTPGGESVIDDPQVEAMMSESSGSRKNPEKIRDIKDVADYRSGNFEVPDGDRCDGPLIVLGDLVCGKGAAISGQIRVHGKVLIGSGAIINGDIFAEGSVTIGKEAVVTGNVFSQEHVEVGAWTGIGRSGSVKTIVGKRSVTLAEGVRLHGYVLTDGRGKVLCGNTS